MDFEQTHGQFFEQHLAHRSGERKGRLARGHHHLEKLFLQNVWWPLFGSFDHLHPEYEVHDWNRKSQFIDFAFLPPFGRFGIECDGYQSHVKEMDREKFDYALNRDNYLLGMGWKMIIGPYYFSNRKESLLLPQEKEILRIAWISGKPIRPKDVSQHYNINFRNSRKRLRA